MITFILEIICYSFYHKKITFEKQNNHMI